MDTTVSESAQVVCTINDPAAHGEQVKATARELIAAGFRVTLTGAPQTLDTASDHRMTKRGAPQLPGEEVRWTANEGTDDVAHIDRGVELRGGVVNLGVVPTATTAVADVDGDQEWAAFSTATGLDESAIYETTPGSQEYVNEKGALCEAHDQGRHILIRFDEDDTELLAAKAELGKSPSLKFGGVDVLFRMNGSGYAVTYPSVRANGRFNSGRYERTGAIIECPAALRSHIIAEAEKTRQAAAERRVQGAVEVTEVDPEELPSGFGRVGEAAQRADHNARLVAWEQGRTIESVLTDPRVPSAWRFEHAGSDATGREQWTAPGPHTSDRSAVTVYSAETGNELLHLFSPNAPEDMKRAFKRGYRAGESYGTWPLTVALIYRGNYQAALVGEGLASPLQEASAEWTAGDTSAKAHAHRRQWLADHGYTWAHTYPAPARYMGVTYLEDRTIVYVETTSDQGTGEATLCAVTVQPAADPECGFASLDLGTGSMTAAPEAATLPQPTPPQPVAAPVEVDEDDTDPTQLPLPVLPDMDLPEVQALIRKAPQALDEVPQTFVDYPQEHAKCLAIWAEVCRRVDLLVAELNEQWKTQLPAESVVRLRNAVWPEAARRAGEGPRWENTPGAERVAAYGKDEFPVSPRTYVSLMNADDYHRTVFWRTRDKAGSSIGILANEYLETTFRLPVGVQCAPQLDNQPPNLYFGLIASSGKGKTATRKGRAFTYDDAHLTEVKEAAARAEEKRQEQQEQQEQNLKSLAALKEAVAEKQPTKKQEKEIAELAAQAEATLPEPRPLDLGLGRGRTPNNSSAMRNMLTRQVSLPGGGTKLVAKENVRVFFDWDEGKAMTKGMGAGGHSRDTGMDTALSSMWSNEPFFEDTVSQGSVEFPKGYKGLRVAISMYIQPELAQGLLDTSEQGLLPRFIRLPQDLIYTEAITPEVVQYPSRWVDTIKVADMKPEQRFVWCDEMVEYNEQVRDNRYSVTTPGNQHAWPQIMRLAAVHAAMDGRTKLNSSDFTVGMAWNLVSEQTLEWVNHVLKQADDKAAADEAERRIRGEQEARNRIAERTAKRQKEIVKVLREADTPWLSATDLADKLGCAPNTATTAVKGLVPHIVCAEKREGDKSKGQKRAMRYALKERLA